MLSQLIKGWSLAIAPCIKHHKMHHCIKYKKQNNSKFDTKFSFLCSHGEKSVSCRVAWFLQFRYCRLHKSRNLSKMTNNPYLFFRIKESSPNAKTVVYVMAPSWFRMWTCRIALVAFVSLAIDTLRNRCISLKYSAKKPDVLWMVDKTKCQHREKCRNIYKI